MTAIEQRYSADHVAPLLCDLRCLLPILLRWETDAMLMLLTEHDAAFAWGWVRKSWSPTGSRGGMMRWKPPSPHILPISLFGFGYPSIPFLRLYKDTKCIVKIIIIRGEMRFVHRWVSRFYWVCNFCNGGGGVAKCFSCIMLISLWGPGLKKIFFLECRLCVYSWVVVLTSWFYIFVKKYSRENKQEQKRSYGEEGRSFDCQG